MNVIVIEPFLDLKLWLPLTNRASPMLSKTLFLLTSCEFIALQKKNFIFRFPWVVSSRETCFMRTQISHSGRGIDGNTGNQIKSASLKKYDQGGEGIGLQEPSLFCYGGTLSWSGVYFLKHSHNFKF